MASAQVGGTLKTLKMLGNLTILWYNNPIETKGFSGYVSYGTGV